MNISFTWPLVMAAHDHNRLARALHTNEKQCLSKSYPYIKHRVTSFKSYHSLQIVMTINTAQGQTLKHGGRYSLSRNFTTASSMRHFSYPVHLRTSQLQVLKGIENAEKNHTFMHQIFNIDKWYKCQTYKLIFDQIFYCFYMRIIRRVKLVSMN